MKCLDCEKELHGGFGVGEAPYKAFRCAVCVVRFDEVANLRVEVAEYRLALRRIWDLCIPTRRGHFRRGLGKLVLEIAADAATYPERQAVAVLSKRDEIV